MSVETICVVGLGYIGLPTAAVFASRKKKVIGVDVSVRAVEIINRGKIHTVEPDLDVTVHSVVTDGWLRATTKPEPADAFLIAVPTPFRDGKLPDLSYIEAASRAIAKVLKSGDLVILESTSPVGATEQMANWLAEERPDLTFPQTHGEDSDIRVAHCPERVLPGHVLRELIQNDRVVGGLTPKCSKAAVDLYKIFVEGDCVVTNAHTAEMCKLTENSFRDVNIAFANELSTICSRLSIDVWELISLANRHPRVSILQPGPGVGGHCIAVDPWFIVASTPEEARLVRAARAINDEKPLWVINKVKQAMGDYLVANPDMTMRDVKVACLGLAFKPNVNDFRESPALLITQTLAGEGINLLAVEPHIEALPESLARRSNVALATLDRAIKESDILLVLVAHNAFRTIERSNIGHDYIVDTVGLWRQT